MLLPPVWDAEVLAAEAEVLQRMHDVGGEDREGQGIAHRLLKRVLPVGDALDSRDRPRTPRDRVLVGEARELPYSLVGDRVRKRPPDGDGRTLVGDVHVLAGTDAEPRDGLGRAWRHVAPHSERGEHVQFLVLRPAVGGSGRSSIPRR